MPKKVAGIKLKLDLLKPESEPKRVAVKLFGWLLSSGRFLIIAVEILVLAAFLVRFKLDADLASTKEAIDQQVPYIESLASDEALIRQTQFQLATIKAVKQNSLDLNKVIQTVASETPSGVTIKTIHTEGSPGKTSIRITATAIDNSAISSFLAGLKKDASLDNLNLVDVSLEQNIINFTITASIKNQNGEES